MYIQYDNPESVPIHPFSFNAFTLRQNTHLNRHILWLLSLLVVIKYDAMSNLKSYKTGYMLLN